MSATAAVWLLGVSSAVRRRAWGALFSLLAIASAALYVVWEAVTGR